MDTVFKLPKGADYGVVEGDTAFEIVLGDESSDDAERVLIPVETVRTITKGRREHRPRKWVVQVIAGTLICVECPSASVAQKLFDVVTSAYDKVKTRSRVSPERLKEA